MLGITKGCGPEELKEAFRTKALLVHPDRGGDGRDFIRLRQAYDQIVAELKRTPSALTVGPSGEILASIVVDVSPNPTGNLT